MVADRDGDIVPRDHSYTLSVFTATGFRASHLTRRFVVLA